MLVGGSRRGGRPNDRVTDVRRASLPVSATRIAELKLGTVIVHPAPGLDVLLWASPDRAARGRDRRVCSGARNVTVHIGDRRVDYPSFDGRPAARAALAGCGWGRRLCCKNSRRNTMGVKSHFLFSLVLQ